MRLLNDCRGLAQAHMPTNNYGQLRPRHIPSQASLGAPLPLFTRRKRALSRMPKREMNRCFAGFVRDRRNMLCKPDSVNCNAHAGNTGLAEGCPEPQSKALA